jgi:hypothetical protein
MNKMGKTHRERVLEALLDLKLANPPEIMNWIKNYYPEDNVNSNSYRADIIGYSINHPSSHNYPDLPKFLWFDGDSKKYRLATEDECKKDHLEYKIKNVDENQMTIDGLPVAKLSITGQIQIPLLIRKNFGLIAGDYIAFVTDKGIIELRKAKLKLELT